MGYEYKDEIIMNIKDYNAGRRVVTGGINDFESKLTELDHIYAQAAKADEYADKAKAFDEISDYWRTKDMLKLGHFVDKAIRKYAGEYESGGYDAKK